MKKEPVVLSSLVTDPVKTETDINTSISRDYYIVQHNDLIQNNAFLEKNKGNSLTLEEQKILLYAISRIKPDAENLEPQIFDIKSFCTICGINYSGKNYKNLKSAITRIASRVMWLITPERETMVRWISKAIIEKKNGKIIIEFDQDLKPYLINLYSNYTRFSLHNVIRMKSKYGIMLYELLKSYYYKGQTLQFSIEDLKTRLDCESYDSFTNFKKYVIEPALKDINTYSEMIVETEYKKTGRTYTDIIFYMRDLEKSKSIEDQEEMQRRYYATEKEINPDQLSLFADY